MAAMARTPTVGFYFVSFVREERGKEAGKNVRTTPTAMPAVGGPESESGSALEALSADVISFEDVGPVGSAELVWLGSVRSNAVPVDEGRPVIVLSVSSASVSLSTGSDFAVGRPLGGASCDESGGCVLDGGMSPEGSGAAAGGATPSPSDDPSRSCPWLPSLLSLPSFWSPRSPPRLLLESSPSELPSVDSPSLPLPFPGSSSPRSPSLVPGLAMIFTSTPSLLPPSPSSSASLWLASVSPRPEKVFAGPLSLFPLPRPVSSFPPLLASSSPLPTPLSASSGLGPSSPAGALKAPKVPCLPPPGPDEPSSLPLPPRSPSPLLEVLSDDPKELSSPGLPGWSPSPPFPVWSNDPNGVFPPRAPPELSRIPLPSFPPSPSNQSPNPGAGNGFPPSRFDGKSPSDDMVRSAERRP